MDDDRVMALSCRQQALELLVMYLLMQQYVAAGDNRAAVARSVREMLCSTVAQIPVVGYDTASSDLLSAEISEHIGRVLDDAANVAESYVGLSRG